MPVSGQDIQANVELLNATLSAYLSRVKGGPVPVTNLLLRNTYFFGQLLKRRKLELDGGSDIKFDAIGIAPGTGGFVAPMQVRRPRQTRSTIRGKIDWSFYENHTTVSYEEAELNNGDQEKLFDIQENRMEAMFTESANDLDDAFTDELGGHDRLGDEDRPFAGLKFWITRDGLGVDGGHSVAQISGQTYPAWQNAYCGPLGGNLNDTHTLDTSQAITSGAQLINRLDLMREFIRFETPAGIDLRFASDEREKNMKDMMVILADTIGYMTLRESLRYVNRADVMTNAETTVPDPVYYGVKVKRMGTLGLDSGGIPSYAAHGDIAAAAYPNTGEVFMLNMDTWRPIGHSGNVMKKMPTVFKEDQQCYWTLWKWWLSVLCNLRNRNGVIWGFAALPPA